MVEENNKEPINIEDGCLDGIAFQIGIQPFMRCHYQSGYVLSMIEDKPLEKNPLFEKLHIKLTPELSEKVFNMMDGEKKVFPNGLSSIIDNTYPLW